MNKFVLTLPGKHIEVLESRLYSLEQRVAELEMQLRAGDLLTPSES